MKTSDLNLFGVGDIVTIPHCKGFEMVTIVNINDGGVAVKTPTQPYVVLSGKSPAHTYIAPIQSAESPENIKGPVAIKIPAKYSIDNLQIPKEEFTIADFAALNNIPYPYALKWVKDNCKEAGHATKKPGQRGKAAILYRA